MTPHKPKRVVAIGEVLWDIIDDKKRLGGAPLNFAVHAGQFGHDAWIVSRVGDDLRGRQILSAIEQMGLGRDFIQVDPERSTGVVNVSVNMFGEPKFDISENAAWDYIEATDAHRTLVSTADVVWYSTLAQRSKTSRNAIRELLETARNAPRDILIVYELNLRQKYHTPEVVRESIEYCRVLKMDEDEFRSIKALFGMGHLSDREFAVELMDTFALLLIAVTYGPRGCILHTPDAEVKHPGYVVDVVDTVGSGRAFTAAMVTQLLDGARFNEVARYANLAGAYVATQSGATPRFDRHVLQNFELSLQGQ